MFSDFVVFKIFMQFFRIFIKKSKFSFPSIYFPMTFQRSSLLLFFFLPHFCHKPVKVWDQFEILKPNIIRKLSKDKFMYWCNQKLTCNLTAIHALIKKIIVISAEFWTKITFFNEQHSHRHLILSHYLFIKSRVFSTNVQKFTALSISSSFLP